LANEFCLLYEESMTGSPVYGAHAYSSRHRG